eukprot:1192180-Prorocentrum_minimum.AAC.5
MWGFVFEGVLRSAKKPGARLGRPTRPQLTLGRLQASFGRLLLRPFGTLKLQSAEILINRGRSRHSLDGLSASSPSARHLLKGYPDSIEGQKSRTTSTQQPIDSDPIYTLVPNTKLAEELADALRG